MRSRFRGRPNRGGRPKTVSVVGGIKRLPLRTSSAASLGASGLTVSPRQMKKPIVQSSGNKNNVAETTAVDKPWMTDEIKKEILKKHEIQQQLAKSGDPQFLEQFRAQRRKVSSLVHHAKASAKKKLATPIVSSTPKIPSLFAKKMKRPTFGSLSAVRQGPTSGPSTSGRSSLAIPQVVATGTQSTIFKKKGRKTFYNPWITDAIKSELVTRQTIYTQAMEAQSPALWTAYRNQRNHVNQMVKNARLAYERQTDMQVLNFAKAWLSAELNSEVIKKDILHNEATETMRPDSYAAFQEQSTKVVALLNKVKQVHEWMASNIKNQYDFDSDQLRAIYGLIEKCGHVGCEFRAQAKIVEFHMQMVHESGHTFNILELDISEEIKKWKEDIKISGRTRQEMLPIGDIRGYSTPKLPFSAGPEFALGIVEQKMALSSAMAMQLATVQKELQGVSLLNFLSETAPAGDKQKGLPVTGPLANLTQEASSVLPQASVRNTGSVWKDGGLSSVHSQEPKLTGDRRVNNLPRQNPRQNLPRQNPPRQNPPRQNPPRQNPPRQNPPRQNPGQNLPRQNPSQNLPRQNPSQNLPRQSPGQNLPRQNPSQNLPRQNPSQNLPRQNPSQNLPRQNPSQNLPRQNPSQNLPRQNPSQNLPRQNPNRKRNLQVNPIRQNSRTVQRSPLLHSLSSRHQIPDPSNDDRNKRRKLSRDEISRSHDDSLQNKYSFSHESRKDAGLIRDVKNEKVGNISSQVKQPSEAVAPTKGLMSRMVALQVLERAKNSDNVHIKALREKLFAELLKNEFGGSFPDTFKNVSKDKFSPPRRNEEMSRDDAGLPRRERFSHQQANIPPRYHRRTSLQSRQSFG